MHELRDYQMQGAEKMASQEATLLADEMGLGKTAQAIEVINITEPKTVLIVCPASLKHNWKEELEKWLLWPSYKIGIVNGNTVPKGCDILIINYDILDRHTPIVCDLLIADEVHYAKNPFAIRTKALTWVQVKRRILITGTPIYNRPLCLWPILYMLDPARWGSYNAYGREYCDGKFYGDEWDFRGASNLDRLRGEIQPYLIRRKKKDYLTELPAKVRNVIQVDLKRTENFRGMSSWKDLSDSQFMEKLQSFDDAGNFGAASLEDIARVRHETALRKVPAVIELINNIMDAGEKVVVFAWHVDILQILYDEYKEVCVGITGKTPVDRRQEFVHRFQGSPSCRVFLGQMKAAGVGLTLTAAHQVVFVELPWTPGEVTQAEDRCHRLGQRNVVVVNHVVGKDTFDHRMARGIVKKQNVIDGVFD